MAQNNHIRERLAEITSKAPAEKEWWDSKKASIQSEFMKELDDEKVKSEEDGVLVEKVGGKKVKA